MASPNKPRRCHRCGKLISWVHLEGEAQWKPPIAIDREPYQWGCLYVTLAWHGGLRARLTPYEGVITTEKSGPRPGKYERHKCADPVMRHVRRQELGQRLRRMTTGRRQIAFDTETKKMEPMAENIVLEVRTRRKDKEER